VVKIFGLRQKGVKATKPGPWKLVRTMRSMAQHGEGFNAQDQLVMEVRVFEPSEELF